MIIFSGIRQHFQRMKNTIAFSLKDVLSEQSKLRRSTAPFSLPQRRLFHDGHKSQAYPSFHAWRGKLSSLPTRCMDGLCFSRTLLKKSTFNFGIFMANTVANEMLCYRSEAMNTMRMMKLVISTVIGSILITACQLNTDDGFRILSVDQDLHDEMVATNVFGSHSPVPIERLKLIQVKYVDFDGREQTGELIVMDACSEQVRQIFMDLYERRFALAAVKLMTNFRGNDSLSMVHNNTSAHNLRPITGGKGLSLHAYGTAIDINPVNNPYIDIPCTDSLGIAQFEPIAGMAFANRMENRLGKENRKGMAEAVIDIFAKNGFYWWGGYWNCPIDYQHFQLSRSITELLSVMPPEEAKVFFGKVQSFYNRTGIPIENALEEKIVVRASIAEFYEAQPEKFKQVVDEIF